jgi:hypothetical protein
MVRRTVMAKSLRWLTVMAAVMFALGGIARSQGRDDETRALRERLERRFDIVALSDGVGLRPKTRAGDVRLIEITAGAVLVNGSAVTGRELRDRLGDDADAVLRVSYLSAADLKAFEAPPAQRGQAGEAQPRPSEEPPLESARPPDVEARRAAEEARWPRRSHGDRIRIFGDVSVERDEEITGQVVAVFGSVRVNGKVGDQVVAVMGSVLLGPDSVVGGDVVSVGGRVYRESGSDVRRGVTEVAMDELPFGVHVGPWNSWGDMPWFTSFGAIPRLFGTALRLSLLLLVTGIALIIARRGVEASAERVIENPLKVTVVGLLAELLALPVLVLTVIVLSISIIGIPLLLLLPFVVVGLIFMALVGFTGTAAAVGGLVQRRLSGGVRVDFAAVLVGLLVILSPLLIARLLALGGWPLTPVAVVLVGVGFAVELLAWASGFGAMLMNAFTRWQARRPFRGGAVTSQV